MNVLVKNQDFYKYQLSIKIIFPYIHDSAISFKAGMVKSVQLFYQNAR